MHRRFYAILWIAIIFIGAGCNDGGDIQLTLVSQNVALSTEIADIRGTATYAADRLNQTAEFFGTTIAQGSGQTALLSVTLAASGVNPALVTPGAPIPTRPIENVPPQQPITNVTPIVTDASGAAVTSSAVGTSTAPAVPSLFNIVTTDGVGSNDCALGTVSSFSAATEQIYVVATAANITPGTRLSSQWYQGGTEVVFHDFTPDFTIEENCIWFYIDETDIPFTPGSWSVQLSINDTPASSPVAFTITE
jgi:hypothetical protein